MYRSSSKDRTRARHSQPNDLRYDVGEPELRRLRRAGANRGSQRFPACSPRPSITPSAAPNTPPRGGGGPGISGDAEAVGPAMDNAGYPVSERADPARLRVEVGKT